MKKLFFEPYIWYSAEIASTWPEGDIPNGYSLLIYYGCADLEVHTYHRPDFCKNHYKKDKFMFIKLP